VRPYLVLSVGATLAVTLIGIPFALIWFLGIGQWWARHYYDKLECELGDTALRFRKGILFQVEKTIPLENIQDVTFIEGPVLRRFDLSVLKFETAGQSQGQAHAMRLIGIIDAHHFRSRILERREALKERLTGRGDGVAAADDLLSAVRALDERLQEIAALLRAHRS
jgi:putative membrane protein